MTKNQHSSTKQRSTGKDATPEASDVVELTPWLGSHQDPLSPTGSNFPDFTRLLQVMDASMSPEIITGDFIGIDPAKAAKNGDIVIVRSRHGEMHLRKYRQVDGDEFDAWSTNQDFATLNSRDHQLSVVAVVVSRMRMM